MKASPRRRFRGVEGPGDGLVGVSAAVNLGAFRYEIPSRSRQTSSWIHPNIVPVLYIN
jgi:hypothetical protein